MIAKSLFRIEVRKDGKTREYLAGKEDCWDLWWSLRVDYTVTIYDMAGVKQEPEKGELGLIGFSP